MLRRIVNKKLFSISVIDTLPFPFEYTYSPSSFQHHDTRFLEFDSLSKLYPKQLSHIQAVFKSLQNLLNKKSIKGDWTEEYIHEILKSKVSDYLLVQQQYGISQKVRIKQEEIKNVNGFLQIEGASKDIKYIHEYEFMRDQTKLKVLPKEFIKKMSYKEDMNKTIDQMKEKDGQNIVEKVRQGMSKNSVYKEMFFKIMDQVMSQKKQSSFKMDSYILVERIDSKMQIQTGQKKMEVEMVSKWLYNVDHNENDDVRKSRKRTLFDFQFWNRGTFIPVKQFVQK